MTTDRFKGYKHTVGMSRRFEAPDLRLLLPRWLVRILGTVVQAFVPAVFDCGQDLLLGRPINAPLVADDHPRHVLATLDGASGKLRGCRYRRYSEPADWALPSPVTPNVWMLMAVPIASPHLHRCHYLFPVLEPASS